MKKLTAEQIHEIDKECYSVIGKLQTNPSMMRFSKKLSKTNYSIEEIYKLEMEFGYTTNHDYKKNFSKALIDAEFKLNFNEEFLGYLK